METMKNKTFPNPEWLHRMADAEDRCPSIAVGGLAHDMGMLQTPAAEVPKVFGRLIEFARREKGLIEFARREKGLSVEALAEAANVELAEIVAIETESNVVPMPRTVYQLAQVLRLPAHSLTELAGLTQPRQVLSQAAVRFAARSEPTARLSADEKVAFEEFVKVIVEASDGG